MKDLGFLTNRWFSVSTILACLALITSFLAGYYWFQYTDILSRLGGIAIYVNVGIDYGNQTRAWHNATKALTGMTLFRVTRDIANVTYATYVGFGPYITSINGLESSGTCGWVWWKLGPNWTRIDIGADSYAVADNETLLWYYESWPPTLPP